MREIYRATKLLVLLVIAVVVLIPEAKVSAQHIWCCDEGKKSYYLETDEMCVDVAGWYSVDVITVLTKTKDFLSKDTWEFRRDEDVVWYRNKKENGAAKDSDLATAIYETMMENKNLIKNVFHVPNKI